MGSSSPLLGDMFSECKECDDIAADLKSANLEVRFFLFYPGGEALGVLLSLIDVGSASIPT